jgi:tetratricopeptide (TPR) repeat protein
LIKADASKSVGSQNPDATDYVLRGQVLLWPPSVRDKLAAARAWFEQALKIEPNNSDALAGSAQAYSISYAFGWTDAETDYEATIIERADRAIKFAPDDYHGYFAKSLYLTVSGRSSDGLRVAEAGLAMAPNSADLWGMRSVAESYLLKFEQAKSDVQHAMRLSPHDSSFALWRTYMAYAEFGLEHFDAAIDEAKKAIDAGHRGFPSYLVLAAASALKGDIDGAKTALAEARRQNPKISVKFLLLYRPFYAPALDALRNAGLPEE